MESMKFAQLCDVFEKIQSSAKDKKLKYLNKLISSSRESCSSLGPSFFSLLRILLPKLDRERKYGVKEHTLAKTYIRILCLPKEGMDANKLLKFRSPTAGNSAGDFADVAYWVLRSRCRDGGLLSVKAVDSHLDKIAYLHANNKPRGVDDELTEILLKMSAEEQKWLIRLLLKDLKLGVSQTAVFNAIHPDAKELYEVCNNLQKVCEKLQDPQKRLHEIDISLFQPCCPMLSERCDIMKVDSILRKAPFYYVERKHDGERFQVHINHDSFHYYSRNGKDYSNESYGNSKKAGTLTPLLGNQLKSNIQTCILDGEMMGWNTKLKCFGSKGQKFDVKYLKEGDLYRPCLCVFDILMLNGQVLTNKPLQERIQILDSVFTPLEGIVMSTPRKQVTSRSEVVQALNDAIDNREEGLILKEPQSIYKPAARKGGWYKIKPEYTVGLTDELDLIIMGGYYGDGRRKAHVSHFLVGVAVPPKHDGDCPQEFHSVGRVGSGYSDEELREIVEKLSPHWRPVKRGEMPSGLSWAKERPDLWIEPKNSLILQVKATEIVQSDLYKTGYTLRFPRVEKVRYDKKWSECCTTVEFEKLKLSNSGKLASRHVNPDIPESSSVKRQRTKIVPVVGRDYQAADLSSTTLRGSLFGGREICVLSGNDRVTKQVLEKCIHEQGGIVVQHKGPKTFCIVAGRKDYRLKNLLDSGDVDIVTVDWLLRVLDGGTMLEWGPLDLLAMSSKTRSDLELKYDSFGDSYQKPVNETELKVLLRKVSENGSAITLLPSEMGDLDVELFSGINEFAVFRCCAAHFVAPSKEAQMSNYDLHRAMFLFHGGRVSELECSDLTHVIISPQDHENFANIQSLNRSRYKKFHIVTYDWIESCWATRKRLQEGEFHPNSELYSN